MLQRAPANLYTAPDTPERGRGRMWVLVGAGSAVSSAGTMVIVGISIVRHRQRRVTGAASDDQGVASRLGADLHAGGAGLAVAAAAAVVHG